MGKGLSSASASAQAGAAQQTTSSCAASAGESAFQSAKAITIPTVPQICFGYRPAAMIFRGENGSGARRERERSPAGTGAEPGANGADPAGTEQAGGNAGPPGGNVRGLAWEYWQTSAERSPRLAGTRRPTRERRWPRGAARASGNASGPHRHPFHTLMILPPRRTFDAQ
ncbi:hypothetical protein Vau01_027030 [Virgisporangium aurantiacum]|uniref:Uncharacterized protein n=1 Tax=Virgisporangium aurantiacum TaxID=175570 RepID=A0A8J3Z220_9ACTN|nr:hypothetical protein Vau01_027030 [Virgisporangium aurantiacum]